MVKADRDKLVIATGEADICRQSRQTETETDRQTETERQRETDRETETERHRDSNRETDRQRQRQRQTETQTDIDTERHRERQRDTHRETERETQRDRYEDGQTERESSKVSKTKQISIQINQTTSHTVTFKPISKSREHMPFRLITVYSTGRKALTEHYRKANWLRLWLVRRVVIEQVRLASLLWIIQMYSLWQARNSVEHVHYRSLPKATSAAI